MSAIVEIAYRVGEQLIYNLSFRLKFLMRYSMAREERHDYNFRHDEYTKGAYILDSLLTVCLTQFWSLNTNTMLDLKKDQVSLRKNANKIEFYDIKRENRSKNWLVVFNALQF
jgi:hypothetical protein